jgi:hypothetical protein
MSFPKPETIESRIERTQKELQRLRLLLKMARIYEPKTPKADKQAQPQDPGGRAK